MVSLISPFSINIPNAIVLIFYFLAAAAAALIKAQVPTNQTFKILNQGRLGEFENFAYTTEYAANYRIITNHFYDFYTFPFRLCFYNTTPTGFVLGIRAGDPNDNDLMRWVWDANRNRPVGENASLSFGKDGNLVIANANGQLVWQTNTANEGAVGIKLLPNGNLVLFDKKGNFIWQSFDYPVDTLLVGMAIRMNVNKLVSRTSGIDGTDGKYSLVLKDNGLLLFLNNSGQQLWYNGWPGNWGKKVVFAAEPAPFAPANSPAYRLVLHIYLNDVSPLPSTTDGVQDLMVIIDYNATLSFLRLESDGNIKAYTYNTQAPMSSKWSQTFSFFSSNYEDVCRLPSKCDSYGLCSNGMCIGCPTRKGVVGWSENCQPPTLKSCRSIPKPNYYKIVGAEHFLNGFNVLGHDFGEGPIEVDACRNKCSLDCQCKGFIYKEDVSKCRLLPILGTLSKDANNTSVAYIKY